MLLLWIRTLACAASAKNHQMRILAAPDHVELLHGALLTSRHTSSRNSEARTPILVAVLAFRTLRIGAFHRCEPLSIR